MENTKVEIDYSYQDTFIHQHCNELSDMYELLRRTNIAINNRLREMKTNLIHLEEAYNKNKETYACVLTNVNEESITNFNKVSV